MKDVEKYMIQFDLEIQGRLRELRKLFFLISPTCEESIRYNMPAYKIGNIHLYFAAYKKHIGFYSVYGLAEIEEKLSRYRAKNTNDSLHFPHNKPLPIELVKEIIKLKSALK